MEIEVTMLMEIGVNRHCHVVTDTHHSTKGVGTQTHVGILTHILKRLSLLLHRVVGRTFTKHLDVGCLHFHSLT